MEVFIFGNQFLSVISWRNCLQSYMITIDDIARWLRKTQGRDKLCKVLQYVCRLLTDYYSSRSEYKTLIYSTLFQALRESRKLFRFFKSIDEFQAIKQLIFYGEEGVSTILQIAYRICYFLYWILDNLSISAKIRVFTLDWKLLHRISLKVRCVALFISLAAFLYQHPPSPEAATTARLKAYRNIFDLLPSLKDSGLAQGMNQKLAGMGGLISSLISTYQIFIEQ